jgi:hypothetical protein
MPVYHDHRGADRRLFVGVDQGTDYIGQLADVGERDNITIRYGRTDDGAGEETVSAYLSEAATALTRWETAPVVTYGGHATGKDYARLVRAVQIVNTVLPVGVKMRIASSSPLSDPENGIHVDFVLRSDFPNPNAWGDATTFSEGSRITHARIRINEAYAVVPEPSSLGPAFNAPAWGIEQVNREGTIVLVHELMHALGIQRHASQAFDSIMEGTVEIYKTEQDIPQPLSLLYPVDREAVRALYINGGDFTQFGPWKSSSLHIHGNGAHAGFGVALRNGYAEPWAYGYLPDMDLGANGELSGNVTWDGLLLGLTPDGGAVAGDARIGVDLGTMSGRADFTELETWSSEPGQPGTGQQWHDGDLGYTIAVRGNTFAETGGDDGTLTGIFTGSGHEGVAGTLERQDLTAAFGGER